jgi:hypothetical protein
MTLLSYRPDKPGLSDCSNEFAFVAGDPSGFNLSLLISYSISDFISIFPDPV